MFWLILAMLLAVALAVFVLGLVALPARRAGRAVFTPRGERVFRVEDRSANTGVGGRKTPDAAPVRREGNDAG